MFSQPGSLSIYTGAFPQVSYKMNLKSPLEAKGTDGDNPGGLSVVAPAG